MNDVAITVPYGRADEALSLLRKLGAGVYHGETDGKTTIYKTPNLDVSALILHTLDLLDALVECADGLEAAMRENYRDMLDYPHNRAKLERDLEPVSRARAAIAKALGQ